MQQTPRRQRQAHARHMNIYTSTHDSARSFERAVNALLAPITSGRTLDGRAKKGGSTIPTVIRCCATMHRTMSDGASRATAQLRCQSKMLPPRQASSCRLESDCLPPRNVATLKVIREKEPSASELEPGSHVDSFVCQCQTRSAFAHSLRFFPKATATAARAVDASSLSSASTSSCLQGSRVRATSGRGHHSQKAKGQCDERTRCRYCVVGIKRKAGERVDAWRAFALGRLPR
eukprot:1901510-Pleurochrysis_carterae.AAC.8